MNRLIKNELAKIFHKKAIYIVLIVTLGFIIFENVMTKIFENQSDTYYMDSFKYYEQRISELDKNKVEEREEYIWIKSELEMQKLKNKYGRDSWQTYVIDNNGYSIAQNLNRSEIEKELGINSEKEENTDMDKYLDETYDNAKTYEEYKQEYDEFIKKLDSGDWKYYAHEELNNINEQIEEVKNNNDEASLKNLESLNIEKQGLEWRLEKDISYGNSKESICIDSWVFGKQSIMQYDEEAKKTNKSYKEKYEYQKNVAEVALLQNTIENDRHNMSESYVNDGYIISTANDSNLIQVFYSYSLFIIIAIVIIAGTIVSEEFNKGTIKLLLVRPYKRTKILAAKFITCILILLMIFCSVAIMQTVVGGIVNGFNDYNGKILIYNYNTNVVQEIGTIKYMLLTAIGQMPQFILIMTLAFTISVIFNNSPVAIAIPLVGMMGSEIINSLAYQFNKVAQILKYFVTVNWDWTIFFFGKMPRFEPISLPFSIIICVIYFVIMIISSWLVFKKRDIKNI